MTVKEGDIFISKLERNYFGAFRILKTNGKTSFTKSLECILVGVTKYARLVKPNLTDNDVSEILIEKRFFCNNKPSIGIRVIKGIENFEYLGNIPLSINERDYKIKIGDGTNGCYPFYGSFDEDFGYEAFLEWRWKNEKDEFKKEIEVQKEKSRIARKEYRKRTMKPKKMLDNHLFWKVIEQIDWTKEDDNERMQPAIGALAKKKVSEIKQFQENLTFKLYQLDTKKHAKNIGIESYVNKETHFSVDYFLYVRCCVVANGKIVFDNAIKNPKTMPKYVDFEALLYLANEAYEKRMNKDLEYETGCDYETYSNIKGWK